MRDNVDDLDYAAKYGRLLSSVDRMRAHDLFGGEPVSPALAMLPPPPAPIGERASLDELRAHAVWRRDWERLRRAGIGASEMPAIAGIPGAYGSAFAYWWEKKAGGFDDFEPETDEILLMGTRLESVIGQVWQERHPESLLCRPGAGLYADSAYAWLLATPDFLAVTRCPGNDPDEPPFIVVEPVECKAYDGGKGWGTPGTGEVPPHIACQVLIQCEVLGALRGHVARLQGKKVTTYTIERFPADGGNQALVEKWLRIGGEFMWSLQGDQPPDIDGAEDTTKVLALLNDMDEDTVAVVSDDVAQAYRVAQDQMRQATKLHRMAANIIRAAMGNAQYAEDGNGVRIASRRVYKRRSYEVAATMIDAIYPAE